MTTIENLTDNELLAELKGRRDHLRYSVIGTNVLRTSAIRKLKEIERELTSRGVAFPAARPFKVNSSLTRIPFPDVDAFSGFSNVLNIGERPTAR